jgi:crossover junction endodeoxyribonuclease RuvC
MIILGIDPGTASTGYGVVRVEGKNSLEALTYGCIHTLASTPRPMRLKEIFEALTALISQYHPDVIAIEQLFFSKNSKTALRVGEALGVVLLASACAGVEVAEYTPLQVKETLTGFGRAAKDDVCEMVMLHLGLEKPPRPDDAADGLAIALCHHFRLALGGIF